jgi:hypothetical protein
VSETLAIPLRGTSGEPVDFARTIVSHGVAELPPNRVELEARTLETTLPAVRGARTVRISEQNGALRIDIVETIRHMFRLNEDLSGFYGVGRRRPRARLVRRRRRPNAARPNGL